MGSKENGRQSVLMGAGVNFGLQCLQVCSSPRIPWRKTGREYSVPDTDEDHEARERCDGMPKRGGNIWETGVLNAGPSDSGCYPGDRYYGTALMTSSARVPTFSSRS